MCKLNEARHFASLEQGSARLNLPAAAQAAKGASKETDFRTIELDQLSTIPIPPYEILARTNDECSRTHLCR